MPNAQGAVLSGTLWNIVVVGSHLVRDKPKTELDFDAKRWKAGEHLSLFIAEPSEQICPSTLPSNLVVSYTAQCCDSYPMKGTCIVPWPIRVVRKVSN